MNRFFSALRRHPVRASLVGAAALIVIAAAVVLPLYFMRKDSVRVTVTPPEPRALEENAVIPPLSIGFSASAARIELAGKEVTQGITISPAIKGKWTWSDDRTLVFFPRTDWLPGTGYTVSFERSIFSPRVKIVDTAVSFRAAPFSAKITDTQLYIDPVHPEIKRITATVSFTHPVRVEEFARAVRLRMPFTITWDKFLATAYVVSENIPVPEKSTQEEVRIVGSFASSRGGVPFSANLRQEVRVPGRYDYATLRGIEPSLVRTDTYEYRKILVVDANLGMKPDEVGKALEVYLLPRDRPESPGTGAEENHEWSLEEVDAHLLSLSTRLELTALPIEGEYGAQVSFSYTAPSGRWLYVRMKDQVETFGGYVIKDGAKQVVQVPPIPKEVRIMSEGSLLALSGEKKIALYSNDLEHVRFEIGRIIPDQVNNLVTQTEGDMKDISFGQEASFGLENISSIYHEVRKLRTGEPGQIQYFSFDFDRYLRQEADERLRYGLFYFKVSEWDPAEEKETDVRAERLILVTDLGILVKKCAATGYDVFIQSIHSGAPVGGATVDVVGKNGLPVVSMATAADGHIFIPSLEGFAREKAPEAFVVTRGNDMSFLPVSGTGRFLDFSRFDIGGIEGTADPGFIDAYLFSDRGIYRPGELVNFAAIVKAGDWKRKLAGLPLELSIQDPRGLEIQKQKISLSAAGYEQFSFRTEGTAPTGKYELALYIARDKEERKLLGSTSIKIEEFQPDRLNIRARFAADTDKAWVSPRDLKAVVTLMNLYGTPAAENTVQAAISLSPTSLFFDKFPDYTFFDPLGEGKTFDDELPEKKTDAAGTAEFPMDLERFDNATFRLSFAADGVEKQGGRAVHAESSIVVSPLASVVGYKPDGRLDYIDRNAARTVRFISVGPDQAPVPLSALALSVTELRWVSVLEKGDDNLYHYRSVEKRVPVRDAPFAISRDGAALKLPTDSPGDYEVAVKDKDGVKLSSFRFSVIGAGNLARSLDRNAELQVRLDRADYSAGDTVTVSVKAPYTGAGLITIERDKVYAWTWFTSSTTATVQTITVPSTVEGSAYVNVSFIRAADSREIYTSPLSYGVVPISINRDARTNRITLKAPEQILGGTPLSLTYSSEKPGRIIVFAVDEGILQVARYRTPDPLEHFFAKRALEVSTSQILDLILPEFSVVQQVSAMGGDEGEAALERGLNPFKRKMKAPVVFWSGLMPTDATPRTVQYPVPDYFNGTLRVMAVAVSDSTIGVREERTLVRNHFVISPNVPPVLTPNDEAEIGVTVMNGLDAKDRAGKETSVRIDMTTSSELEMVSGGSVTEKIGAQQEKTVFFKVKARNTLGSGTVTFTASGGGKSSTLAESVSIRPATPFRVQLDSGSTRTTSTEVPLERTMHGEFRTLQATASYLPSSLSWGLKQYLDSYPYGCTEQVVSRAFAVLALRRLPEFAVTEQEGMAAFTRAQAVLRARQNQEGAFGLWAATEDGDPFITAYAMHYLSEAREAGYPVDSALFDAGMGAMKTLAGGDPKYAHTPHIAAAYAIYVLTRNGVVTTSFINSLRAPGVLAGDWKDGPVAVFLAGAYALLKENGTARALLNGAFNARWNVRWAGDYYSDLAQGSLCLYLASRHLPEAAGSIADKAIQRISDDLVQGAFNTITSSYATLGLTSYAASSALTAQQRLRVTRKVKDGVYEDLPLSGTALLKADVPYGSLAVKISNPTGSTVYYQVLQSGFDLAPPTETTRAGLEAFREYTDAGGKAVTTVPVGTEVKVHVKIRTVGGKKPTVENVAIVDMLPSGFEIVHDRAADTPLGEGSLAVDNVEPREDRLLIFCTAESGLKDFVYTIRSVNKGTFAVPPVIAGSMYDRAIWTQHPSEGFITVGN
jgi:alpha-2-macroglobulin